MEMKLSYKSIKALKKVCKEKKISFIKGLCLCYLVPSYRAVKYLLRNPCKKCIHFIGKACIIKGTIIEIENNFSCPQKK